MDRFLLRYEPGMKKVVTRIWWCGFQQGNIGWHLVGCSNSEENMTNTSSGSNSTWGAFTPVMPAFIRLIAGVIVLVIIEAVVFCFPGFSHNIPRSTISISKISEFIIWLVVGLMVFELLIQISETVSDPYNN